MIGLLKAETKDEIKEILAKKLYIESPDNDFSDAGTKAAQAAFLMEHQQLLNLLGKDEIFYHLELTSELYSDRRPGFQPHAAYALGLYFKFHDEYSKEENEIIANKIREFAGKGWIPEENFKHFQSIQSQQKSTKSSVAPREPKGTSDKTLTPSLESRPNDEPHESTSPHSSAERDSKSAETDSFIPSMRWPLAVGAIVLGLGLLWTVFKKRK